MGSPPVGDVEICVDQGVAFGDLGGGVLRSVKCVSPCGWHPVDTPVHFRTFGRPHGQRDAFGLAGGLIAALNAESSSIGMAVTCLTVRPGQRAAEMRTASGLRVRRCVWLSGVTALTGAIGWRATLSAISCPVVAAEI
ncbi:MAG: hypothetical protein OXE84_00400 [Rhodobacteraceae bacterium]|nr:hypothetical protein [Paracoccaceae bacterium]MCY4196194.1 hypothetical protein [Paracoccaceae bacterium]MCY4327589.1 hypothetical protein [Paracoccaceae bacterium]